MCAKRRQDRIDARQKEIAERNATSSNVDGRDLMVNAEHDNLHISLESSDLARPNIDRMLAILTFVAGATISVLNAEGIIEWNWIAATTLFAALMGFADWSILVHGCPGKSWRFKCVVIVALLFCEGTIGWYGGRTAYLRDNKPGAVSEPPKVIAGPLSQPPSSATGGMPAGFSDKSEKKKISDIASDESEKEQMDEYQEIEKKYLTARDRGDQGRGAFIANKFFLAVVLFKDAEKGDDRVTLGPYCPLYAYSLIGAGRREEGEAMIKSFPAKISDAVKKGVPLGQKANIDSILEWNRVVIDKNTSPEDVLFGDVGRQIKGLDNSTVP